MLDSSESELTNDCIGSIVSKLTDIVVGYITFLYTKQMLIYNIDFFEIDILKEK